MAKGDRKNKKRKTAKDGPKKTGKAKASERAGKARKAERKRKPKKDKALEPRRLAADARELAARDQRKRWDRDEEPRGKRRMLQIPDLKDRPEISPPTEPDNDASGYAVTGERHGRPPRLKVNTASRAATTIEGTAGMPVVSPGPPDHEPWWKEVDPAKRLTYPYCAIGQIFTTYRNGPSDVPASAALVGRALLITAAHCLDHYDYGRAESVVFVPAYEDGPRQRPLGEWRERSLEDIVPHPNWRTDTGAINWRYDVGIVRLAPNKKGELPGDICGSFTLDWPFTGKQVVESYGYPDLPGYGSFDPKLPSLDGGDLVQSRGHFEGLYPHFGANGPVAVVSGFGSGASGGPWVTNIYPAQPGAATPATSVKTNCIVGVNSFIDSSYPTRMFSPQLVRSAKFLVDAVNQDGLDHPPA